MHSASRVHNVGATPFTLDSGFAQRVNPSLSQKFAAEIFDGRPARSAAPMRIGRITSGQGDTSNQLLSPPAFGAQAQASPLRAATDSSAADQLGAAALRLRVTRRA